MFNDINDEKINYSNFDKSTYREFLNEKESYDWGFSIYKEWALDYRKAFLLTKGICNGNMVQNPIEEYCKFMYKDINKYLRTDTDSSNDNLTRGTTTLLAMALASAPRIPCNIIIYRLVCNEFIKELTNQNKEFFYETENGFMSVSLVKKILLEQNEPYSKHSHLLKIYLKQNQIGVYVNAIDSIYKRDQELLLFPGSHLRMIALPYKDIDSDKIIYECELSLNKYDYLMIG